jgi:hypothetical protein
MKTFLSWTILTGILASLAYADSPPMVAMSAKMITSSIPSITFTVKNPGRDIAKTRVFTIDGKEIAELDAKSINRFSWDGKDVDQEDVPAGLYVVQIHHGGQVWHGPVMVNR